MWERIFLKNTLEDWGISLLFIAGAFLIMKLVSLIGKKLIRPVVQRTRTKLDDVVYYSIEGPLLFAIMLVGLWIAIHNLTFPEHYIKIVRSSYKVLASLNITWFFARLSSSLIEEYWAGDAKHKALPLIRRTVLSVAWVIGIVTALSNVGINISAILGTLGIGGIAFALAAQDTVKNVFGAFTILTDKPFRIGDVVRIDTFEGTIVDIGMRSTKLQNYDKRIITIPNYKVADANIINISSEKRHRRVTVKLGLTYDTTPEKMKEAISILKSIPQKVAFVKPDDATAWFSEFADSAMVITFTYYIDKKADIQEVTSNVNLEILTTFNAASLNFAFPSQSLYIEKK